MMRVSPHPEARNNPTGSRFVGLLRTSPDSHPMLWEGFNARVGTSDAWGVNLDTGYVTLAARHEVSMPLGTHGLIIGEVFRKHDGSRVTRVSSEDAARTAAGDFRELIDQFWGPYVAIVDDVDTHEIRVLRAPLGELPCLVVPVGEAFAIASDVDMLGAFGLYDPLVDWSELARELGRKLINRVELSALA